MQVIMVTKQKNFNVAIPFSVDCSFQKTIDNVSNFYFIF